MPKPAKFPTHGPFTPTSWALRACFLAAAAVLTATLALAASNSPAADWTDTRRAGPFVCRADFSLADSASQDLLGQLAQLPTDLSRRLGIPPQSEQIEVYLFHDQATYARYLGHYLPGVPYRRALFAKGRGPGECLPTAATSSRSICDTNAPMPCCMLLCPKCRSGSTRAWPAISSPPRSERAYDNPHLESLRSRARPIVPSLEELEKKGGMADMGAAEYRDSWAWVHFMLHGPAAAHEELTAYLAALRVAPRRHRSACGYASIYRISSDSLLSTSELGSDEDRRLPAPRHNSLSKLVPVVTTGATG